MHRLAADEILIFLHLPKTAGSTMRRVVMKQFDPSRVVELRQGHDSEMRRLIGEIVHAANENIPFQVPTLPDPNRTFLEQHKNRLTEDPRLLVGHFYYGLHRGVAAPCRYLTYLRNPVERVASLYHHRVRNHGLRTDLAAYMKRGIDPQVINEQTRRLAGVSVGTEIPFDCDGRHLEEAKSNLRESIFGLTEHFDQSLLLIRRALGWTNVLYTPTNVRPSAQNTHLDTAARAAIEERNELDIELYRFASALMAERVAEAGISERDVRVFERKNSMYKRTRKILGAGRSAAAKLRPRSR